MTISICKVPINNLVLLTLLLSVDINKTIIKYIHFVQHKSTVVLILYFP